jgi:hypothetical protein
MAILCFYPPDSSPQAEVSIAVKAINEAIATILKVNC